jgi:predicted transcriptional regulator
MKIVKKKRDIFEIVKNLLLLLDEDKSTTSQLMKSLSLNNTKMNQIINFLLKNNYIENDLMDILDDRVRGFFKITKKGINLLGKLIELKLILKEIS